MAVVLANTTLTVRNRQVPAERDSWGTRVVSPDVLGDPIGPYPGAVTEPDSVKDGTGAGWRLRVDDRVPAIRPMDQITDGRGRVFVVRTARLIAVPGCNAADHYAVVADLEPPTVE